MKNRIYKFLAKLTTVATMVSMFAAVQPASAATPTLMKDTLDRLKVSTVATHSISMTLPGVGITPATTGALVITFTGFGTFTGSGTAVCGAGTAAVTTSTNTVTITSGATACSGTLTVTGLSNTNPAGAGSNTVTMTGNAANLAGGNPLSGSFAIATVTDDQVSVTASVDPSITFNVGAQATPSSTCTGAFAGNGGTVALGTLSTSAITSSDVSSVNHICTRVSTNAASGAVVTVKSLNGSLKSASTTDNIPSASAAMAIGTSNYGLCASGSVTGKDVTVPVGASPTSAAPFNGSCVADTAAGTVGALTTSAQTVWSTTGAVSNGFYLLVLKAAISATQPAHNDYGDTLTFVATGTF